MASFAYKAGDLVRVVRVPPAVLEHMPFETITLFTSCIGNVLRIERIRDHDHTLQFNVKRDGTQAPNNCYHTLWIEPEYVERVGTRTRLQRLIYQSNNRGRS